MEIVPCACHENLRRFLRRRRYQRLSSPTNSQKRLKITRPGGGGPWKSTSKRRLKLILHVRLLAKLHKAHVWMMVRLVNVIGNLKCLGFLRGKRVKRCEPVHVATTGEDVDGRLLMEYYKRLVGSGEFALS